MLAGGVHPLSVWYNESSNQITQPPRRHIMKNNKFRLMMIINDCTSEYVAGYGNCFYDFSEEEEEYIEALEVLNNVNETTQVVIESVKHELKKTHNKNLKFEGDEALKIMVSKRVESMIKEIKAEHHIN